MFYSVVYAKIYGIQLILNQIGLQDSARLLNEFNYRIDQLIKVKINQNLSYFVFSATILYEFKQQALMSF